MAEGAHKPKSRRHLFAFGFSIILIFIFVAYNGYLVSSPHLIRVSLIQVIETPSATKFYTSPDLLPEGFLFEDQAIVASFEFKHPTSKGDKDIEYAIHLMQYLGDLYVQTKPQAQPESPKAIAGGLVEESKRGHCYNDSILLATLLQKEGYFVRLLALTGKDGMGGAVHSVIEVWSSKLKKWILLDPQQIAYFADETGQLLSTYEVRMLVMNGNFGSIQVRQHPRGFQVKTNELESFYTKVMPDLHFLANNRYFTNFESSWVYGVSERLETLAEKSTALMQIGRFFRSFFATQVRWRVLDAQNTGSYRPHVWFYVYRFLFIGFVVGCLLLARLGWIFLKQRSRTKTPPPSTGEEATI